MKGGKGHNTWGGRLAGVSAPRSGDRWAWMCAYGVLAALGMLPGATPAAEVYHINEGVAFYAYETPGPYRQPVFRLRSAKDIHAFTTSEAFRTKLVDDGAKPEKSGIYVLSIQFEGTKRLYQFRRKRKGDLRTILTVSEECRSDLLSKPNEYEEIEQECYVFPPEFKPNHEPVAPVYVLRNAFTDEYFYTLSKDEIENVLGKWSARRDRIQKNVADLAQPERRLSEIVPVGQTAHVGKLTWRFVFFQNLGRELPRKGKDGKTLKSKIKGAFAYFDVEITNASESAVPLRAPVLWLGNSKSRLSCDTHATEVFVDSESRLGAGEKLEPGQSKRFRFVYDMPAKARDVTIEIYSEDPADKQIILLDTGV